MANPYQPHFIFSSDVLAKGWYLAAESVNTSASQRLFPIGYEGRSQAYCKCLIVGLSKICTSWSVHTPHMITTYFGIASMQIHSVVVDFSKVSSVETTFNYAVPIESSGVSF